MRTQQLGAHLIRSTARAIRDIFSNTLHLAPIVAFIFISSTPAQSLAYVDYIELNQEPLDFVRDETLPNIAIIGIEKFPKHKTAGALLKSRSSTIPSAATNLAPGAVVRVMATAYSSTVGETDSSPFTTASGTRVHRGTLAANFLPFGSQVRIGNQLYTVEDRLNARYNGKYIVDLWFPSRAEALQFGVRVVEMELVAIAQKK